MSTRPQHLESTTMAEVLLPCYGGPYDGKFFPETRQPSGYRIFLVRGKNIWLWNTMRVERLDFTILGKASKILPSAFDYQDPEDIK